jgi:hypothetical protein
MWQHHVFVCALFLVQGVILMSDFSQEIYVLPDDDMQCAIETRRSSESVLMCIILDQYMIYN